MRKRPTLKNFDLFEDSLNGSLAAVASGAFTVAVPGHHSMELDFSHANLVVETLASTELLALFRATQTR